jgi:hypothetical protein
MGYADRSDRGLVVGFRLTDRTCALIAASGLLATAAFVILVIHPGGFEGQIGWAFALMPGSIVGLSLAERVFKASIPAGRAALWSSLFGVSFLWYFVISYAAIKACRFLARALGS